MLRTREIIRFFQTLEAFEKFAMEWTEACCMINKGSRNQTEKERFDRAKEVREREVSVNDGRN